MKTLALIAWIKREGTPMKTLAIAAAAIMFATTTLAGPVFCPTCAARKIRSKVTIGPVVEVTLVEASPYYDEDGKYVYGEVTETTQKFACERGHVFTKTKVTGEDAVVTVVRSTDLKPTELVKDGAVVAKPVRIDPR